jgi:hypothetical protein
MRYSQVEENTGGFNRWAGHSGVIASSRHRGVGASGLFMMLVGSADVAGASR